MKMSSIAAVAVAGAMMAGGAHAATFVDYVNVLVPGHTAVTFTSFNDNSPEFFIGITAVPVGFVQGTVILTEPDGTFSDLLSLLLDPNGGVDIFFFSDPSLVPPVDISPNQLTLTETGKVQDVSSFFGGGATVQVGSDLNMTGIPEPAAWTMMLVGLSIAGGIMRVRRTAKVAA